MSEHIRKNKLFTLILNLKNIPGEYDYFTTEFNKFLVYEFDVECKLKDGSVPRDIGFGRYHLEVEIFRGEERNFTYINFEQIVKYLQELKDIVIYYRIILNNGVDFIIHSKKCVYDKTEKIKVSESAIGIFLKNDLSNYDKRFSLIDCIECSSLDKKDEDYIFIGNGFFKFEIDYEIYLKLFEFVKHQYEGHSFQLKFN
jgi:hypothetical protein